MPEISLDELRRWAAATTLADSYMSLVYHRGGIQKWGTNNTPALRKWEAAMHKTRLASEEIRAVLKVYGVDDHAAAREMDQP